MAAVISMADYVRYVEQERKEQWSALATVRGHSFPNCMVNNGETKSYKLLDAQGNPLRDKNGKPLEINSATIGLKASFNACLKAKGIYHALTQLTGIGKDAIEWYFQYQSEKYHQNSVKLDAGGERYLYRSSELYVPRRIMWNKLDAYYIKNDKTAFAGDKDVHRYMLAIVLENDIKEPAVEAGVAAANTRLLTFEKYIARVGNLDSLLADEMQFTLDAMRKALQEEVPDTIEQHLSKWSEKYLLPEILKSRLHILKSGNEDEDE